MHSKIVRSFYRHLVLDYSKQKGNPIPLAQLECEDLAQAPIDWNGYGTPGDTNRLVCLLNESILQTVSEVDFYIKKSITCGTTMVSLFLLLSPEDGTTTAVCANVGDSKCVMVAPLFCADASNTSHYLDDSTGIFDTYESSSVKGTLQS